MPEPDPYDCAICGEPYVVRTLARECEATHADCPYGDPCCPCPDGDACHYQGHDAWPDPCQ
jgi:hypothetical protein